MWIHVIWLLLSTAFNSFCAFLLWQYKIRPSLDFAVCATLFIINETALIVTAEYYEQKWRTPTVYFLCLFSAILYAVMSVHSVMRYIHRLQCASYYHLHMNQVNKIMDVTADVFPSIFVRNRWNNNLELYEKLHSFTDSIVKDAMKECDVSPRYFYY